jgi:AraC-like DNA-binding protein
MLAGAARRGFRREDLLAAVGIDAGCLEDRSLRIPLARYAALYNHVAITLDDEAFGLFSAPMRGGSFEFLCRCVLSAGTLGEALQRACRFLRLVLPDVAVSLKRAGDRAELAVDEVGARAVDREFALEWLLRLIHGVSCWLVARGIALDEVEFPYARPEHVADYALIYTANSHFDRPRLVARFAAGLLDLPVRRDEAALARFLVDAPGRLTMLYRRDRELATRVRDALREALPELPGQDEVATRLHLSSRTLARRLAAEETSFRAIREGLRRELALARLGQTQTPVARIASDLGYAEPSAFYRAFVAWTGQSPSAWRRANTKA